MLGEHFLDVDIGDHGLVLLQGADIDLVRSARRIDRAKVLGGDEFDGIADRRIIGDAALEFGAFAAGNFAEQVDRRSRHVVHRELSWFSHDTSVIIAMMVVAARSEC